jgi:hypothetical protein
LLAMGAGDFAIEWRNALDKWNNQK